MADQPLWNSADKAAAISLSDSDRTATITTVSAGTVYSTAAVSSGRFWVEWEYVSGTQGRFGLAEASTATSSLPGVAAASWAYFALNGRKINNNATTVYGDALTGGDILGMAVDLVAGKVWWGRNGTWYGDPAAGTGEAFSGLSGSLELCWGAAAVPGTKAATLLQLADYTFSAPAGFAPGWGGVTAIEGEAAVVQAGDSVAGAGGLAIAGAGAPAQAGDQAAGAGALAIAGEGVAAQAGDALAAAAGLAIAGEGTAAQDGDQVEGAGALALAGEAAPQQAGDSVAGAAVLVERFGTADLAQAGDALAAAGTLPLEGAAALAQAGDQLAAAGALPLEGAAALAQADDQLAAAGLFVDRTGEAALEQAADSVAGAGELAIEGTAAVAQAGDQLAAAGALALEGAGTADQAGDSVAGGGALALAGVAALAQDGDQAAGAGALAIAGAAALSQAGDQLAADGVFGTPIEATAALAQAGDGLAAAGLLFDDVPALDPVPTPGDLDALLAGPTVALNWVVVVEPWDAEEEATVPVRWGSRDFTTAPASDPPSTRIPGRLAECEIRGALWQGTELFGRTEAATARITIDDQAGEWRHLATAATSGGGRRWHFRRRAAQVRLGHPAWDWGQYQPVFTGEVEEVEFAEGRIRFELRDRLRGLDEPLSETVFRGNRVLVNSGTSVTVGPGAQSFTLPDLVTNGTFGSSLSGWYAGAGWAQSGGAAVKTAGSASGLVQEIATAAENRYRLRAVVTRSAGSLQPTLDGRPLGEPLTAGATLDVTFVARGSTSKIGFLADASFAGSVDSVTCRLEPEAEAGDPVIAARTSDLSATWMDGVVVSWTPATGVLATQMTAAAGSGSHSDWSIWLRPDEGGADLAGKGVPVLLGTARHFEPVELGSVQGLWLWRLADGPVRVDEALGHRVFDGGEPFDLAASFPPGPGEAFVDGARGRLWTASRPALVLTVTAESLAAARNGLAPVRDAVDLDGSSDWYEAQVSTGEPGLRYETKGTLALRFRIDGGDFQDRSFLHTGGPLDSGFGAFVGSGNQLTFFFKWSGGGEWQPFGTTTLSPGAGWHRLLASWDVAVPRLAVRLDGVAETLSGSPTGTLLPYAPSSAGLVVGRWDGSTPYAWDGALAELWFAHGVELDLADAAVRARFEGPAGEPVELGEVGQLPTGSAPYLYLRGDETDFAVNRGTGPQFTAAGSPATASSTPYAAPDAVEEGEAATAAGLVEAVLRERLGLAPADLDAAAFAALADAAPARLGLRVPEAGGPARETVDRVLSTVGAWLVTAADGTVTVGRYDGPAEAADHLLDARLLLAVPRRVAVGPALWRRRIGAERCWRPHGSTEIAAAATDAVRAFLRQEWREGLAEDEDVRTADLGAEDVFLEAAFDRKADADDEAARQLALSAPSVLAFQAEAGPPALTWALGATVELVAAAAGLAEGRRLVLAAREIRRDGAVTLTLLG